MWDTTCSDKKPPKIPAASITVVKSGSIKVQAMIRVTTNSLKEFTGL
jgi:hypothetical protein